MFNITEFSSWSFCYVHSCDLVEEGAELDGRSLRSERGAVLLYKPHILWRWRINNLMCPVHIT
jgi:hypothetical protein